MNSNSSIWQRKMSQCTLSRAANQLSTVAADRIMQLLLSIRCISFRFTQQPKHPTPVSSTYIFNEQNHVGWCVCVRAE